MSEPKTLTAGDMVLLARRIQERLLEDITDRRGWRQEWDRMDEDIQEEIIAAHTHLILAELAAYPKPST